LHRCHSRIVVAPHWPEPHHPQTTPTATATATTSPLPSPLSENAAVRDRHCHRQPSASVLHPYRPPLLSRPATTITPQPIYTAADTLATTTIAPSPPSATAAARGRHRHPCHRHPRPPPACCTLTAIGHPDHPATNLHHHRYPCIATIASTSTATVTTIRDRCRLQPPPPPPSLRQCVAPFPPPPLSRPATPVIPQHNTNAPRSPPRHPSPHPWQRGWDFSVPCHPHPPPGVSESQAAIFSGPLRCGHRGCVAAVGVAAERRSSDAYTGPSASRAASIKGAKTVASMSRADSPCGACQELVLHRTGISNNNGAAREAKDASCRLPLPEWLC
jgi:hypothetical protein